MAYLYIIEILFHSRFYKMFQFLNPHMKNEEQPLRSEPIEEHSLTPHKFSVIDAAFFDEMHEL